MGDTNVPFAANFEDTTGGGAQSESSLALLEKNRASMEIEGKDLLGDTPLNIDNRVILIHLDTLRFARLKTHEYKAVSGIEYYLFSSAGSLLTCRSVDEGI